LGTKIYLFFSNFFSSFSFFRIGTPQTDDLIGAAAKSAKQMLEEVNPDVIINIFIFLYLFMIIY
jgi:hypothetical protein